jgi:hypothetical protein
MGFVLAIDFLPYPDKGERITYISHCQLVGWGRHEFVFEMRERADTPGQHEKQRKNG